MATPSSFQVNDPVHVLRGEGQPKLEGVVAYLDDNADTEQRLGI
jgi:hypothetical protein